MRVTSAQLVRNFGQYSDAALSEPVVIMKNGRDRLVLLGVDEYNFMRAMLDERREANEQSPATAMTQGQAAKIGFPRKPRQS